MNLEAYDEALALRRVRSGAGGRGHRQRGSHDGRRSPAWQRGGCLHKPGRDLFAASGRSGDPSGLLSRFNRFSYDKAMHKALVGTCGWSCDDWGGPFYPPGTPPSDFLARCSGYGPAIVKAFLAELAKVMDRGRASG